MEAVAFLAGEKHSDQPKCACPIISRYGQVLNDRMGRGQEGNVLRAKYLAPLVSELIGTRSTTQVEEKRVFFFADQAVRLFAPLALDLAGFSEEAKKLRSLPEIVDEKTADDACSAVHAAACSVAHTAYTATDVAVNAAYAAGYASIITLDSVDASGYTNPGRRAARNAADAAADFAWAATEITPENATVAWEQAAQVLADACQIC